jgi:hypothetical protein
MKYENQTKKLTKNLLLIFSILNMIPVYFFIPFNMKVGIFADGIDAVGIFYFAMLIYNFFIIWFTSISLFVICVVNVVKAKKLNQAQSIRICYALLFSIIPVVVNIYLIVFAYMSI